MDDLVTYFPLLFVAFGVLIILVSIKGIVDGRRFAGRAQRVPGVVSDVRTTFAGQGEHLRARRRPVLTFTTVDGREVTTESRTTSDLGVGNATDVLYDPHDPTRAVPAGDTGGGPGGIVAGLIAVVIGLAFFAGVSGAFAGVGGGGAGDAGSGTSGTSETRCEMQNPDGSVEPMECPPGLFDGK
ncbi:DUF3592 domain-containing protein [Nonomuraea roseoviolacea]|uniref:DUF3592 domain-containing protein n=1 Tax=Nonomuraea roseoviolacea subsp. carminata TaxID=160689 RepID=A0ABT1K3W9_9ACTN|nr:DUF3592 domain-containing protein [Nonomuraea roseoviolacea]MCP2348691.1 hypothetical protein [Nonomuraea roseoviolacea subsp. carminata]